jgi:hypothetical protein
LSYLSQPFAYNGAAINIPNPGLVGNQQPAVAVQIRNASGWVIQVQGQTRQIMIDPFTATTVTIAQGQQSIAGIGSLDAYPGSSGYISAEWLASGESPGEPDGPLTSAATIATISGAITTTPQEKVILSPQAFSIVCAGGGQYSQNYSVSINPTDRSIIVFITSTNFPANFSYLKAVLIGNTSGYQYGPGYQIPGTSFTGTQEFVFGLPAYGAEETSFTLQLQAFTVGASTVNGTLMAFSVPDEIVDSQTQLVDANSKLMGIPNNPLTVIESTNLIIDSVYTVANYGGALVTPLPSSSTYGYKVISISMVWIEGVTAGTSFLEITNGVTPLWDNVLALQESTAAGGHSGNIFFTPDWNVTELQMSGGLWAAGFAVSRIDIVYRLLTQ